MGYKKGADGVASKGKTQVEIFPNGGPQAAAVKGSIKKGGVSSMAMKDVGRNLARVANQKKSGRGR